MKLKDTFTPPIVAALSVLGAVAFTVGGFAVTNTSSTTEYPSGVIESPAAPQQPFGFQILVDEPTPTPEPTEEPTPSPTQHSPAPNETIGGGGDGGYPGMSPSPKPSPSRTRTRG